MPSIAEIRELVSAREWQAVTSACESRVQDGNGDGETAYLLALGYLNSGRAQQAASILEKLRKHAPDHPDTLGALHSAWLEAGFPRRAIAPLQRLSDLDPENLSLQRQLASVNMAGERYDEAARICQALLESSPEDVGAWIILSSAQRKRGNVTEAEEAAQKAISLAPKAAEPSVALGWALLEGGKLDQAVKTLDKAGQQARSGSNAATIAEAMDGVALSLTRAGRLDDALTLYARMEQEFRNHLASRVHHGLVLFELGRSSEGLAKLADAINLQPGAIYPRLKAAEVLLELNRLADARGHLEFVLDDEPTLDVLCTLGAIDKKENRLAEALERFERALQIDPDHPGALFGWLTTAQQACHWDAFEPRLTHYLDLFRKNGHWRASPWAFINLPGTTPADHLECANRQARALKKQTPPARDWEHEKIRVAFITWDFHSHPISHLTCEMLEHLDREAFEWHLFYWGPIIDHPHQQRLFDTMDEVHHIHELSDHVAAERIRGMEIDILVDLIGYTQYARPRITAAHPAPMQINWLGHAQTMGEGMADVILLDETICPVGEEAHFSERVLRMPSTYFPTPRSQQASMPGTRADHGLPENAFVFGCFNQTLKITPATFRLWMEIMSRVDDSVLWLLCEEPLIIENLRKEAQDAGIDVNRLIFADKVSHEEHLGRLSHMDLMLDTLTYNGHTTASDALWSGVPVITRMGETFPSRVAASLLKACQLDQLICSSDEQFVDLATEIGKERERIAGLKRHLANNRDKLPLFDSERFARDFEAKLKESLDTK